MVNQKLTQKSNIPLDKNFPSRNEISNKLTKHLNLNKSNSMELDVGIVAIIQQAMHAYH